MNAKITNLAILASGIALLAVFLYTLVALLTGALPPLSGGTIGCVLSLLGGGGLTIWALLRMQLIEVVVVEERSGR